MKLSWDRADHREWADCFWGLVRPYERVRWVRLGRLVLSWGGMAR